MEYIKVKITMQESKPVLSVTPSEIGTVKDNNAQTFQFDVAEELTGCTKKLRFRPGNGEWVEVSTAEDEYVITNALTQKKTLQFQVSFYEGDTFKFSTDAVTLTLRPYPESCNCGPVPEPLPDDLDYLNTHAVTDGMTVGNWNEFYNRFGDIVFKLLAGGGGGTGNVSSSTISTINTIDRADYDALDPKDPGTVYLIKG